MANEALVEVLRGSLCLKSSPNLSGCSAGQGFHGGLVSPLCHMEGNVDAALVGQHGGASRDYEAASVLPGRPVVPQSRNLAGRGRGLALLRLSQLERHVPCGDILLWRLPSFVLRGIGRGS